MPDLLKKCCLNPLIVFAYNKASNLKLTIYPKTHNPTNETIIPSIRPARCGKLIPALSDIASTYNGRETTRRYCLKKVEIVSIVLKCAWAMLLYSANRKDSVLFISIWFSSVIDNNLSCVSKIRVLQTPPLISFLHAPYKKRSIVLLMIYSRFTS